MKTIIAGSRDCTDMRQMLEAVAACGWIPSTVISGAARGADKLGENWAAIHKVPVIRYPAEWNLYQKSAGYRRNEKMAEHAEALIALWDGQSPGTKHMIDIATRKGLRIHIHRTKS